MWGGSVSRMTVLKPISWRLYQKDTSSSHFLMTFRDLIDGRRVIVLGSDEGRERYCDPMSNDKGTPSCEGQSRSTHPTADRGKLTYLLVNMGGLRPGSRAPGVSYSRLRVAL